MTKTVLITGTSSGIGRAVANHFANQGWNVIATMRTPGDGQGFFDKPNIYVARLDVQNQDTIKEAVDRGLERFGHIDVLVNNAGYGQYGIFEAIPREKIMEQFQVNVFGLMDVIRAVLPSMRKARQGVIINLSSGAGIFTLPMISLYCASKFAVEGFSEALSYELGALGITVKIIEPHGGVSDTNFNARSAADIARAGLGDYDAFIKRSSEAFAKMSAARSIDADDVAKAIYDAATDGTDRLRYLVGNDTRGFIKARAEMADQDYVAFMRAHFTG